MVLEKLGSSLKETLTKIAKSIFVDERLINELVKDIQRALLQADVNVKLVFELTREIKKRALEEKPPAGLSRKEQLINIVYEELVKFLGGEKKEIKIAGKKPFKIMLAGLFGSGKTTTAGKLAKFYSKRGFKVALLGLDVWRPAALEQLAQVGKTANVPVMVLEGEKDPVKIYREFLPKYREYDLLVIDTAGRDALNKELIEEIEAINREIKPDESLLVISADIGQAAMSQAEQFHKSLGVKGVIATKMDGTARAGGALSACAVSGAPIKFIGTGEKVDDLEQFNAKGFVGRLLGMGDLEALIEKAKEAITEEEAADMSQKLLTGEFNLIDLYEQMEAMKKMGPLSKVMEMIPGFGQIKLPKELLNVQEGKLRRWKHVLDSCTRHELEDPEMIGKERVDRIAKGAGAQISEVRELLKQYRMSKKMMKMVKGTGGSPEKLMKKMQKGGIKGMKGLGLKGMKLG